MLTAEIKLLEISIIGEGSGQYDIRIEINRERLEYVGEILVELSDNVPGLAKAIVNAIDRRTEK